MQGRVVELFITLDDAKKTRKSVQTVEVDNNGLLEDKFHGKNLQRSVLLTSTDSYKITQENSIDIDTGSLGENILIDVNPYHLVMGDKVHIGNVVLEITQNCTLCKGLSVVNSKLPKLLKDDRGIFAKVISGPSTISVGDIVHID